jgi:hypothetical protein
MKYLLAILPFLLFATGCASTDPQGHPAGTIPY